MKRVDEIDTVEIAREFERLVQGNKQSITSFIHRFFEDADAYKIFYEWTENQDFNKLITRTRVGNQK